MSYMHWNPSLGGPDEIDRIWPKEHRLILRLVAACRRLQWAVWTNPVGPWRNIYQVRRREADGWVGVVSCDSAGLQDVVLRIEREAEKREAA